MSRPVMSALLVCVLVSYLLVLSFKNFFLMWVSLEVGTFCVVPLLFLGGNPRSVEASLKYFMVKVSAALVFLFGGMLLCKKVEAFGVSFLNLSLIPLLEGGGYYYSTSMSLGLMMAPLLMKLGLFPFHLWFPEVVQGVGFLEGLLISTTQKVPPFYLSLLMKQATNSVIPLVMGGMSVLVGGWGGLNQTQVRKMLGFSSISFMGWVFCSMAHSSFMLPFSLLFIYFMLSSPLFIFFYHCHLVSLSSLSKISGFPVFVFFFVGSLFSLMGMPPFGGFILKVVPMFIMMSSGYSLLLLAYMPGALFSLFFYLRLLFNLCFLVPPTSVKTLMGYRQSGYKKILPFILGWLFSLSLLFMGYMDLISNLLTYNSGLFL